MRTILAAGLAAGLAATLAAVAATAVAQQDDGAQELRDEMVGEIRDHVAETAHLFGDGGLSPAVIEAMRTVPRHLFVPERERHLAYADRPVEIGYGQTISQPFIVAAMTDLLNPDPGDTVLEIGTGSGYQAAILSPLVDKVCTIEIIPELGQTAAEALEADGASQRRGEGGRWLLRLA